MPLEKRGRLLRRRLGDVAMLEAITCELLDRLLRWQVVPWPRFASVYGREWGQRRPALEPSIQARGAGASELAASLVAYRYRRIVMFRSFGVFANRLHPFDVCDRRRVLQAQLGSPFLRRLGP